MEKLIFLHVCPTWETILFWTLSLLSGFLLMKSWKKIKNNAWVKNNLALAGDFLILSIPPFVFGFIFALLVTSSSFNIGNIIIALLIALFVAGFPTVIIVFLGIGNHSSGLHGIFTRDFFGANVGAGMSIGWLIHRGSATDQWLSLITILLFSLGILYGYLYERRKERKLATTE